MLMRTHWPRSCAAGRPRRRRGGFTLIEVSLTIVIIGLGVLAAAELLATGTQANADSHRLTTALNLAGNMREYAQQKAAADLLAMDGDVYSPPHDARGNSIDGLEDWEQVIDVEKVSPDWITVDVSKTSTSRLMRLTVSVRYRGAEMTSEMWVLADTEE